MWTIKTQINIYSRESAIGILSAGVAHLEQNRHPAYFSQGRLFLKGRISKGILLFFFFNIQLHFSKWISSFHNFLASCKAKENTHKHVDKLFLAKTILIRT